MNNELKHYGVLGMKWGKRRYQNKDGSLTLAGRKRKAIQQYKSDLLSNNDAYAKSISKVGSVYTKKMKNAKTDEQRRKVEREWIDAVEKHDDNWVSTKSKKEYVNAAKKQYYGEVIDKKYAKASSTTKKVMDDYKKLSDQEFMNKYHGSKVTYGKRVEKYGDPYKNSPAAKIRNNLAKIANKKISEVNQQMTKKRKQKIEDLMFPTKKRRPMDEKMHPSETWTEKPNKKYRGNV